MMILLTFFLLFASNNPPGTVKIKDYYVDKTEMLNIHWLEYVYVKSQSLDSSELQKILPDSLNFWYKSHDSRFKPIVLITHEQALEFCAWRSKIVSEQLGKKVTYRLPTSAEWKEIAEELLRTGLKQAQKDLKANKRLIKNTPGQYVLMDRGKTKNRIYDFFGNVTEMTFKKGVAMGTNNNKLTDLNTNLITVFNYSSPSAYLGFRCIAEIEE